MSGVNGPGLSKKQFQQLVTLQDQSNRQMWENGVGTNGPKKVPELSSEKLGELFDLLGKMNPAQQAQLHQVSLGRIAGRLREQASDYPKDAGRMNQLAEKFEKAAMTPESAANLNMGFMGVNPKGISRDDAAFIRSRLLDPDAAAANKRFSDENKKIFDGLRAEAAAGRKIGGMLEGMAAQAKVDLGKSLAPEIGESIVDRPLSTMGKAAQAEWEAIKRGSDPAP